MAWWTRAREEPPDLAAEWAARAVAHGTPPASLENIGYRSDLAPDPENDPAEAFQALVPADVTVSQILDYTSGGELWPLDLYRISTPTRDTAIQYSTFHRCVHLIAALIAILVSGGGLSVVDQQRRAVNHLPGEGTVNRRARRAVEALTHDPDGELPVIQWIEDVALDYLMDGNFIVWKRRIGGDGRLRLERCFPMQAQTTRGRVSGSLMYEVRPVRDPTATEYVAGRDICHGRWGLTGRAGMSRDGRQNFARPPLIALRPALTIGIQADRWIANYFTSGVKGGAKAKVAVGLAGSVNPDEQEQYAQYIKKAVRSNLPLVLGHDAKYTQLRDGPQDEAAEKLREFQVRECGRIYGIPGPLLGENITQWGSGIATLARLFWQYGGEHHLRRFLAPFESRLLDPGHRFRVDTNRLLQGDPEAVARMLTALGGDAQRRRIAHVEELRDAANLPADDVPPDDRIELAQNGIRGGSGSPADDNRNK